MPGVQRINIRCSEGDLSRLKEAASVKRMSLSTLMMSAGLHAADKILDGGSEVVSTSARVVPQVQAELRPAKKSGYGPDMPIGDMTLAQIERFAADLRADEAAEEERRREREFYSEF